MYQTAESPPQAYELLQELLPDPRERAKALRVSIRIIRELDMGRPHSRNAVPAARARLVADTLQELGESMKPEDARNFLLSDGRERQLLKNGGRAHRKELIDLAISAAYKNKDANHS